MNEELFRDKLDRHERRLNEHSKEIDELANKLKEKEEAENESI